MKISCRLLLICFLMPLLSGATVTLPRIFSNGMVLQQQTEVMIWGKTDTGKPVVVTTSWNNKTYTATPDGANHWKVKIRTPKAGGPYTIKCSDGTDLLLSDIYIGEVWLASGQSNMEMPLKGYKKQPVNDADRVIRESANPQIRFFKVKRTSWTKPLEDCEGTWKSASPSNSPNFSATAYFYAKMLNEKLKVPVGIIEADRGGSTIQAWMSAGSLKEFPGIAVREGIDTAGRDRNEPAGLFNGMINPVAGYGIKGAIWYQGEQNRNEPELYAKLFPAMVKQWRADWGIGDFAFYYAQIAPYISKTPELTEANKKLQPLVPYLREAQLKSEKNIPNAGMIVLMDVGAERTIHPPDKESVGRRLSNLALGKTYGFRDIPFTGPVYKSMKVEGNHIVLYFDGAEGLHFTNGTSANFQIAGGDKKFYPAEAKIEGQTVHVFSPDVKKPEAARYAFEAWVVGDLFNKNNLPASSFRTDGWEISTESGSSLSDE